MDLVYRLAAEHPGIVVLGSVLLPLLGMITSFGLVHRRPILSIASMLGAVAASFFLLGPTSSTTNPYVRAQDIPAWRMAELADLRREHPGLDPLMRRAAADGRIDRGEYEWIVEGDEASRILETEWRERQRLDRLAVLKGIPPVGDAS